MRIKTRRPGEGIILRRHTLLYGLKYCTRRSFARKQRNGKHSRRVRRDRETILTADATVSETIIRSTRAHFQDVEFRFHSNVYTGTVTRVLSFYRSNTETIHVLRSTEYSRQFRAYSNNDRGEGGGTRGGLNGGKIHGGEKGIARKT